MGSGSRPDAILLAPLISASDHNRACPSRRSSGGGGYGMWVVLNRDADYLGGLRSRSSAPVFCRTRDHAEIGRIQGRQFAALLPAGGTVPYIQAPVNNYAAGPRTAGMESTKPGNIHLKALRSNRQEGSACQGVTDGSASPPTARVPLMQWALNTTDRGDRQKSIRRGSLRGGAASTI
jgi:hypothetical protein